MRVFLGVRFSIRFCTFCVLLNEFDFIMLWYRGFFYSWESGNLGIFWC